MVSIFIGVATTALSADHATFVDIQSINRNIQLDIRYATENNFTKRKLYLQARCVVRRSVAEKLSQVQADLEQQQLGLKMYDCYRPLSVQKLMWSLVQDERYVANPLYGSRHNRGAAVDLTLVDASGQEVEMPTDFDNFTDRAHRTYNNISDAAKRNRQILELAMLNRGFVPLPTEWWHFDEQGWRRYPIGDRPIELIPSTAQPAQH